MARTSAILWSALILVVAARAGLSAPAAGDDRGGWFVLPTPPLGAMVMHLPDAEAIGTINRAAAIGSQPLLMAAGDGRLVMAFVSTAESRGLRSWPMRQLRLRATRDFTAIEPLPPLVAEGEPIALAVAGRTLFALVISPANAIEVWTDADAGWKPLGPTELPAGFNQHAPASLLAFAGTAAIWQDQPAKRSSTLWRLNQDKADERLWSPSTLPPIGPASRLIEASGQLLAIREEPDGGSSILLVRTAASAPIEIARIDPHPNDQWIIPTPRGVTLIESDGKPLPRLNCRVIAPTGGVLYEGPARTTGVVDQSELALLGLALSSLLAAVLIFIFRPESSRRESIILPANCALAGPATRAAAGMIDVSFALSASWIVWGYFTDGLLAAASPGGEQGGPILLSAAALAIVVCSISESFWGRSPGKALTGCRVVSASGGRITFAQAVARNVVRFLCPPLGMVWMIQPPHRAAGLFGTVVVIDLPDHEGPDKSPHGDSTD